MNITINGKFASFTCSTVGAELLSFKDSHGKEYLWQKDPNYWAKTSPILFPHIGPECENLRIGEQTYFMPRHGLVRELPFQILKKGENSVTLYTESNEDTKKYFPFDFQFNVSFTLKHDALEVVYTVINQSTTTMPFEIGGHPGFFCPMQEGERFEDYKLMFADMDKDDVMLDYALFDVDAILFENFDTHMIKLVHNKTGHGLEFQFPSYESVAFWTPAKKQAPFLCFEPWNGLTMDQIHETDFMKKKYIQTLGALQKRDYHFHFRPI